MKTKPKALDLFCGAGGASMGLWQAGFEVVGVDNVAQPRYPFTFIKADAMTFPLEGFDFIWASPPCQQYSITKALFRGRKRGHRRLIAPTRKRLAASGLPYVIENVMCAPLKKPIMLCGTMFGLKVYRHRLFESNFPIIAPPHGKHIQGSTGSHRGYSRGNPMVCVAGHNFKREEGEAAMGINWMTSREQLAQAIPPAYAKFIGLAALATLMLSARCSASALMAKRRPMTASIPASGNTLRLAVMGENRISMLKYIRAHPPNRSSPS